MTFSEKAAETVREFLRTAKPGDLVALAREGSPDLFPPEPKPRPAVAKAHKRNGTNGRKK